MSKSVITHLAKTIDPKIHKFQDILTTCFWSKIDILTAPVAFVVYFVQKFELFIIFV